MPYLSEVEKIQVWGGAVVHDHKQARSFNPALAVPYWIVLGNTTTLTISQFSGSGFVEPADFLYRIVFG